MGRLLITIGILFVVIGLFVEFGPHFLPLGHLPGALFCMYRFHVPHASVWPAPE